jgi:hypothetical protein
VAEFVSDTAKSSCIGFKIGVKNIMQISKLSPVICAVAVFASLVCVRAQDNPAQAAARAALMAIMTNSDAASAQPPTSPVAPSGDNPAQAAARAALMEKMSEPDAATVQPPAIVVTPSGATVEKPAPPTIQTPPPAPTLPVASVTNESEIQIPTDAQNAAVLAKEKENAKAEAKAEAQKAAQAKKDAALAEKKRADAEAAAQSEANAKAAQAAKAQKAAAKAGDLGLNPIEAPPLPISAAKQDQLQALLAKYKADQISPEEYQKQRAEILAEP